MWLIRWNLLFLENVPTQAILVSTVILAKIYVIFFILVQRLQVVSMIQQYLAVINAYLYQMKVIEIRAHPTPVVTMVCSVDIKARMNVDESI